MAYTGNYRVGGARFNDQQAGEAFKQALQQSGPGFQGLQAGQYFTGAGGTQFKTVAGIDPNKPGWGQQVEPGYELIGYQGGTQPTGRARGMGIGQPTEGFAILRKQGAPPAAAAVEEPVAAVEDTTPTVEPTEKSKESRSEADTILAGIDTLLQSIRDENARSEAAIAEQFRLDREARTTAAANLAISNRTPNLQIQPASGTPTTGGTQTFRRRQSQFMPGAAGSVLAGLNLGQSSMMNV